jgi:FlaA1/EpsC-like NDP-sugar epimerase
VVNLLRYYQNVAFRDTLPQQPMTNSGLGLANERGFARCPQCQQLIDASVEVCRFCGSRLDPEELKKRAAVQKAFTETTAKANNRRALLAGIAGLIGTVLVYAAGYGFKFWRRWRRQPSR